MSKKRTILSEKDGILLEKTIVDFGSITTFDQLKKVFSSEYSYQEFKNRLTILVKSGWLVRIKRGLYTVVTDITGRSYNSVPFFAISQALNSESYISFANALNYYGMFDQLTRSVDAVTTRKGVQYDVQEYAFRFFKVKPEQYFGFIRQYAEGKLVPIADKEKIVLDYLSLRRTASTLLLLRDTLRSHGREFSAETLVRYAEPYNLTVNRTLGFLLEQSGIDTAALRERVGGRKGYSTVNASSTAFSAAWRLYYDHRITQ